MVGGHVGDLMRQHGRQLVVVLNDFEQAGKDAHLASGHREGVDLLGHFKNDEFPLRIRHIPEHHLGQTVPHPLHALNVFPVSTQRVAFFQFGERLDALLDDLLVRDHADGGATRDGDLVASGAAECPE